MVFYVHDEDTAFVMSLSHPNVKQKKRRRSLKFEGGFRFWFCPKKEGSFSLGAQPHMVKSDMPPQSKAFLSG